jgi:predicted RNA methylase
MTVEPIDDSSNYGHASIHYDMISDTPRTMAYFTAINENSSFFQDKVVLDIGAGSGILSLFAARAGARLVYAVECTPIATVAAEIIADNGYSDRIQLIHSRIESSEIGEKVDIIVSEWMGYALYFERMLTSVVIGRNRYLKPEGKMLPSHSRLFFAAAEVTQYRAEMIDFWDSVYGFDFRAMKRHSISEVLVDDCDPRQVISDSVVISELDLHTCPVDSCFFTSPFHLTIHTARTMDAFVTWFDVFFNDMAVKPTISTAPSAPETHWKQSFFVLESPIQVAVGDLISGSITFSPDPADEFALRCQLSYSVNYTAQKTQNYTLQ